MRLRQVTTLDNHGGLGDHSPVLRLLATSLAGYTRQALLDPETERDKDAWDLAAFGQNGQAGFTAISQGWLRQCAKDWALDDLTRRRGRKLGTHLRQRVALIAALSASLRTRLDHGEEHINVGTADRSRVPCRLGTIHRRPFAAAGRHRTAMLGHLHRPAGGIAQT